MRDFVKKTVIINRAVPGSGETTNSNCIISFLQSKDIDVAIHSTNEYFMTDEGRDDFKINCLYVIECKAGSGNSEHVMKPQNIVRYFGGIEGKAVLNSCFYPKNKVITKKIDDSKNLQSVSGNSLFRQLEEMIQPGGRRR